MNHKRKNKFLKICCHIIFLIYFILLIKIVLFKYSGFITTFDRLITGELSGFHSLNLIPFQTILEFTKLMFDGHFERGFNNVAGNVLVFAPFGYFMPLLYKKCQKWKIVISAGACISLLFEICQYFLYLGSSDIDDILLNTLGVSLGFLFFKFMKRITYKKQTKRYVFTIILSLIGFITAGYLAVNYFGVMFGISNRHKQTAGNNNLPDDFIINEQTVDISRDVSNDVSNNISNNISNDSSNDSSDNELDIWGDIASFDDSSVTINKTTIEDSGNVSIATINVENPELKTVYITETTKYTLKDIYDINGNKVEMREAAREDLEIGRHINIKCYESDGKLFAAEIIINHYLFM